LEFDVSASERTRCARDCGISAGVHVSQETSRDAIGNELGYAGRCEWVGSRALRQSPERGACPCEVLWIEPTLAAEVTHSGVMIGRLRGPVLRTECPQVAAARLGCYEAFLRWRVIQDVGAGGAAGTTVRFTSASSLSDTFLRIFWNRLRTSDTSAGVNRERVRRTIKACLLRISNGRAPERSYQTTTMARRTAPSDGAVRQGIRPRHRCSTILRAPRRVAGGN
jgi:hypothetical protein